MGEPPVEPKGETRCAQAHRVSCGQAPPDPHTTISIPSPHTVPSWEAMALAARQSCDLSHQSRNLAQSPGTDVTAECGCVTRASDAMCHAEVYFETAKLCKEQKAFYSQI